MTETTSANMLESFLPTPPADGAGAPDCEKQAIPVFVRAVFAKPVLAMGAARGTKSARGSSQAKPSCVTVHPRRVPLLETMRTNINPLWLTGTCPTFRFNAVEQGNLLLDCQDRGLGNRSEWKMMDLILAVLCAEALDGQKQLINSLSLRQMIAHEEDPWHGFSSVNSVISEAGNGVAIVRKQNSLFAGSPGQDSGVWRFREFDILDAHHIQVRHTAKQAAEDVAVEVFVSQQLDHEATLSRARGPAILPY
jgi:hypothetical protein